ncbi:MAG: protein translocase subunit SecF [Rhodocyclaceae bacterium]|nr:protein translocase subunit SecF [Rhodocyclaceae bacterium]
MEFFRIRKDIPFMRHALAFNIVSLITFLAAVFFLATQGLHLSIEFTGGTLMEVGYAQAPALDKLRGQLEADGFTDTQVQNFGSSRDVLIRVPLLKNEAKNTETAKVGERVMASLLKVSAADTPTLKRAEFVGPQVGRELAEDGALALLLVIIGIVGYLAMRFEWRFAISAIIANLHDVIIILGFFAFFQWEFSLPVLAAVLAVLGYSVNESVVVFDRVRETFKKKRGLTTPEVLNHAITSTISRTIITHGCTQMMVTSMLIFGGAALHYFALALTIGILFGIYSSVLVASPLVMWLGVSREQFIKPKKERIEGMTDDGAVV